MEQLLISSKLIKANKVLKTIQKQYLKDHKVLKTKISKTKLGKVVKFNGNYIDCTGIQERSINEPVLPETAKELLEVFRAKNIRGLSGSGFPEADKIEAVMRSAAERKYFIVNAVACDPGLVHDAWLLENHKDEIQKGIDIICKCMNFKKSVIASPSNIPAKYPMGSENLLIKYLLGVDIDKNEIPADKGILVMNVQTIYSVYKAFYLEDEEDNRLITVADLDSGEAEVVRARIGQSIFEIMSAAMPETVKKDIYYGMGAMGGIKAEAEDKLTIHTNFITYASVTASFDNDSRCRGCGKCASKCPMNVQVNRIMRDDEKNIYSHMKDYGIDYCIGCGTCSYYCRASKNTMQIIKNIQNHK